MGRTAYIVRRLIEAIPTLLILLVIVFSLVRLTGDPAQLYLGDFATQDALAEVRRAWGLDRPLIEQFARYAGGLLRGDLGGSLRFSRPVTDLIAERFLSSLTLAATAMLFAVAVALPLGTIAALARGTLLDAVIRLVIVLGQAIPRFYLGVLFVILFGLYLRWLPTSGAGTFAHIVLPAITLATPTISLLARLTRSSVLDVIHQDYVRTARAKGLTSASVNLKHVLRNALMTPLTIITIQFSQLIGGAVVVEAVFGWPGLGQLAIQSVYTRDFPLIQGIVLVFTLIVVVMNILTDLLYGFIDPRVSYQ